MAYIYCITNNINGKQYVGKTTKTPEERFKEHIQDRKRKRTEKRPLYSAMNKYGVENFSLTVLKECSIEELSKYEMYYIDKLNTYHCGYNATKGGDGKFLFDYDKIVELYKNGLNQSQIAKELSCTTETVRAALLEYNIPIKQIDSDYYYSSENGIHKKLKIQMLDPNTNQLIRKFNSAADAGKWLLENNYLKKYCSGVRGHIADCARGKKQKIAYGFRWKLDEE